LLIIKHALSLDFSDWVLHGWGFDHRWSLIAARMPGRTDNDIKNHWNTRLKKKLCNMGIDPVTHKPISELLRDIAGTMQPDGSSAAGCNNPVRTSCLDHPHPIISLDCAI
jgi:hypothetical protein